MAWRPNAHAQPPVRCSGKFDAHQVSCQLHQHSLLHHHVDPRQHRLRDRQTHGLCGPKRRPAPHSPPGRPVRDHWPAGAER